MHWCESCHGTEFLDQELNEHEDDEKLNYYQWDTADQSLLPLFAATYK